jgi:hypothetical protein
VRSPLLAGLRTDDIGALLEHLEVYGSRRYAVRRGVRARRGAFVRARGASSLGERRCSCGGAPAELRLRRPCAGRRRARAHPCQSGDQGAPGPPYAGRFRASGGRASGRRAAISRSWKRSIDACFAMT